MKSIAEFIGRLALAGTFDNVTNQFSFEQSTNKIRRDNLFSYLSLMQNRNPTTMLISEAPGYNGMRRTGVPFTSERLLLNHTFFKDGNFQVVRHDDIKAEQSATIVWSVLDSISSNILMWPAFPFHPHKSNELESNRPPTKMELVYGKQFVHALSLLFGIKTTIAVGRKAEKTLTSLDYRPKYVRHPAQAGATEFREGMAKLFPTKKG